MRSSACGSARWIASRTRRRMAWTSGGKVAMYASTVLGWSVMEDGPPPDAELIAVARAAQPASAGDEPPRIRFPRYRSADVRSTRIASARTTRHAVCWLGFVQASFPDHPAVHILI